MINTTSNNKNVYVVLGMARSGTSVISRGLKALGVDLGSKLTPGSKWNPKGFWEDNDIVYKINERVLAALNCSWDTVKLIDKTHQVDDTLTDFKKRAAELLTQRFASTERWGFKDPRTVKILPFWQSVFQSINVKENYVIALRNPLSSAQSYQRLTGTDVEHGLLLWLMHLLGSVNGSQGKSRVIVSYDLLMQNPRKQLDRIQQNLSLPLLAESTEIEAYVDGFLDKTLHHYEYSFEDLQSHPATSVAPLCLKIYAWLLKIAKDEITWSDTRFTLAWQEIENEFNKLSSIYSYIDTLLQRNDVLKKSMHTLHKSRLWKMIYPLRVIDDALRARRRKAKQRRLAGVNV